MRHLQAVTIFFLLKFSSGGDLSMSPCMGRLAGGCVMPGLVHPEHHHHHHCPYRSPHTSLSGCMFRSVNLSRHVADQCLPCSPILASLCSETAPEIAFTHNMGASHHVKFGLLLADTAVSSPELAVSRSPTSKVGTPIFIWGSSQSCVKISIDFDRAGHFPAGRAVS